MTEGRRPTVTRPGTFGEIVAADARRGAFDLSNEQLIGRGLPIAAVFVGDSITEWWELAAFFRGASGLVVNRGIAGDSTHYMRRRFEADVLQLRPHLAVVLIGVNNTWELDGPAPESERPSPQAIEDRIVADVDAAVGAAIATGINVALGSILPTSGSTLTSTGVRNDLILRANRRLRELAGRHGALYVDYHAAMVEADGRTLRHELADDGLHPHIEGYTVMSGVLLDALHSQGWGNILEASSSGSQEVRS